MALRLPPYQPLPAPLPGGELLEVPIAQLRPTQLCVGLAEVRSRLRDFGAENTRERLSYLGSETHRVLTHSSCPVLVVR